jgi:hypothetical protein
MAQELAADAPDGDDLIDAFVGGNLVFRCWLRGTAAGDLENPCLSRNTVQHQT